jgi:hypothetical protein
VEATRPGNEEGESSERRNTGGSATVQEFWIEDNILEGDGRQDATEVSGTAEPGGCIWGGTRAIDDTLLRERQKPSFESALSTKPKNSG